MFRSATRTTLLMISAENFVSIYPPQHVQLSVLHQHNIKYTNYEIFSILSFHRLVTSFTHSILHLSNIAIIMGCYGHVGRYLGLNYSSGLSEGGSSSLYATHRYFTACHVWARR